MIKEKYAIVFVRATKGGYTLRTEEVSCLKKWDYTFLVWDSFTETYTNCHCVVRSWSQFQQDIPINDDDILMAISSMVF
jgi:hypothetical protein